MLACMGRISYWMTGSLRHPKPSLDRTMPLSVEDALAITDLTLHQAGVSGCCRWKVSPGNGSTPKRRLLSVLGSGVTWNQPSNTHLARLGWYSEAISMSSLPRQGRRLRASCSVSPWVSSHKGRRTSIGSGNLESLRGARHHRERVSYRPWLNQAHRGGSSGGLRLSTKRVIARHGWGSTADFNSHSHGNDERHKCEGNSWPDVTGRSMQLGANDD